MFAGSFQLTLIQVMPSIEVQTAALPVSFTPDATNPRDHDETVSEYPSAPEMGAAVQLTPSPENSSRGPVCCSDELALVDGHRS